MSFPLAVPFPAKVIGAAVGQGEGPCVLVDVPVLLNSTEKVNRPSEIAVASTVSVPVDDVVDAEHVIQGSAVKTELD